MRAPVVLLVLALITPGHAADVAVRYLVDDGTLKEVGTGSALNPTLFTDSACTHALFGATLPITGAVVSRLKLFKPKHGPKAPKIDLMTFTMTGVPPYDGALYLVVTGPGVVPVGTPCQVQGGTAAAPPLTTSTVTVVDENGALGFRIRAASDPLVVGVPIVPVTREAASALIPLTVANPFDCTVDVRREGSGAALPGRQTGGLQCLRLRCTRAVVHGWTEESGRDGHRLRRLGVCPAVRLPAARRCLQPVCSDALQQRGQGRTGDRHRLRWPGGGGRHMRRLPGREVMRVGRGSESKLCQPGVHCRRVSLDSTRSARRATRRVARSRSP